mgnify:FL=1
MYNLKNLKLRIIFSASCLFILFCFVGFKVFQKGINNLEPKFVSSKRPELYKEKRYRGIIQDRNGYILATTVNTHDLILNPSLIKNPTKTAKDIKAILKDLSFENIFQKLNSKLKYTKLKKNISHTDYYKILKLGIPGTRIEKSFIRKYPAKNVASHLIGNVDTEGNGVSGIELTKQKDLLSGKNIKLTIHSGVQHIFRNLINKQINKFEAVGGAGVIINVKDGQIFSLVSLPDYDNNKVNFLNEEQKFNKATKGIYELGSTLKIFTAAMALETGLINDKTLIDVSKPIKISSYTIKDHRPIKFSISLPEVIVHSSNIGSAKIAGLLGHVIQEKYIKLLGFDRKLNMDLIELGKPRINNDKKLLSTMTKSYGYGIQISPLHLAFGTAAVINEGFLMEPKIFLSDKVRKQSAKKIFSKNTSEKMRSILRLVVQNKYGTGKKANAIGYLVGGKTGTAHKINSKGNYSKNEKIVAFTGGFPMNKPEFVFTIMIDNPKPQKFSSYRATGGWVVAPLVSKLITRIAPILGVNPDLENKNNNLNQLKNYKIRGAEL